MEVARLWPYHGQNMVLTWSFQLVLPESLSLCPKILHYKICHKHYMSYSDYQGRSYVFLFFVAVDKKYFSVCRVGYSYCHQLSLVIITDI